jgi:hypothetical protein
MLYKGPHDMTSTSIAMRLSLNVGKLASDFCQGGVTDGVYRPKSYYTTQMVSNSGKETNNLISHCRLMAIPPVRKEGDTSDLEQESSWSDNGSTKRNQWKANIAILFFSKHTESL